MQHLNCRIHNDRLILAGKICEICSVGVSCHMAATLGSTISVPAAEDRVAAHGMGAEVHDSAGICFKDCT